MVQDAGQKPKHIREQGMIRIRKISKKMTSFLKGWTLTDPRLFVKKDAAYPDSSDDKVVSLNKMMLKEAYYKDSNLTIDALCRKTNTNRSYLSRSIHRMYGTNFCDWVNVFRITEAKKLLDKSDGNYLDLEDLAIQCGFNSVRSFSRVFKAREHCTPKQYHRESMKKKA